MREHDKRTGHEMDPPNHAWPYGADVVGSGHEIWLIMRTTSYILPLSREYDGETGWHG